MEKNKFVPLIQIRLVRCAAINGSNVCFHVYRKSAASLHFDIKIGIRILLFMNKGNENIVLGNDVEIFFLTTGSKKINGHFVNIKQLYKQIKVKMKTHRDRHSHSDAASFSFWNLSLIYRGCFFLLEQQTLPELPTQPS